MKSLGNCPVLLDNSCTVQNRLLRSLSPTDFKQLQPYLTPTPLHLREVLVRAGEPIRQVHFIEAGIVSVLATLADGSQLEVGLFGREGMSGAAVLLGADQTPHLCFVQVPGSALRVETEVLRELMADSRTLHMALLKFVQALTIQTAHTAVANGNYNIQERLARWLLMCRDRLDTNELPVTHEFLAMMLAVRRSGVTLAIQMLEGVGVIRAERGRVTILKRAKLEQIADGSYGPPEEEYERLIGSFR